MLHCIFCIKAGQLCMVSISANLKLCGSVSRIIQMVVMFLSCSYHNIFPWGGIIFPVIAASRNSNIQRLQIYSNCFQSVHQFLPGEELNSFKGQVKLLTIKCSTKGYTYNILECILCGMIFILSWVIIIWSKSSWDNVCVHCGQWTRVQTQLMYSARFENCFLNNHQ